MEKAHVPFVARRAAKLFLRDWVGVDLYDNGDGRTSAFAKALDNSDGLSKVAAQADEREDLLTAQFANMMIAQVNARDGHVYFCADCDYGPNDTLVQLGSAIGMTQFPWKSSFRIEDYGATQICSSRGYGVRGDSHYLMDDGWLVMSPKASMQELLPLVRRAVKDGLPEVAGLATFEAHDTEIPGSAKSSTMGREELLEAFENTAYQLGVGEREEGESDSGFIARVNATARKAAGALYQVESESKAAAERVKAVVGL